MTTDITKMVSKANSEIRQAASAVDMFDIDDAVVHSISVDMQSYNVPQDEVAIDGDDWPYLRYAIICKAVDNGDITQKITESITIDDSDTQLQQ